jgi:hypothetical protein
MGGGDQLDQAGRYLDEDNNAACLKQLSFFLFELIFFTTG